MGEAGAVAGVAALTAVVGVAAVWMARALGRWFRKAIGSSVTDAIRDVTAPDIAALTKAIDELSASLATAIDELAASNNSQHAEVEHRLSSVESRLLVVESKLNIRPPEARTRATDTKEV